MIHDDKLIYFDSLPAEILEHIWSFVTPLAKSGVDKSNYSKFYAHRINNIAERDNIERYIRFVVSKDYVFLLENILTLKFEHWFNIKNYHYKYTIYPNMMYFLYNFSLQNNSQKCRTHISEQFSNRGISKNLHKKNRIRNIGWIK